MKIITLILTATLLFIGTAYATTKHVPVPPKRPASFVVNQNGVVVKAPVGADVIVDVDGKDVDVSIEDDRDSWLPWNW